MFSASSGLYDTIYCRMKDYAAEARTIAALLEKARPGVRSVLDVGCGTGEHARHLAAAHGLSVDGIDLDPGFVAIAGRKNPRARFECADMREFDLGRTYDAVLCLFSSIGYVRTLDGVAATLERFRAHLSPGGVIVVEPWFPPGKFQHGHVSLHTAEGDGVTISRMSHSVVEGRISRVHFEYLIGRAGGISRASEDHELGLFTTDEMQACFAGAGLAFEYDPVGLMNRGLYVARPA
jgi:SAM-dependent methyltransferase